MATNLAVQANPRRQQSLALVAILLLSLAITYASFAVDSFEAEAYLFPRLLALVLVGLTLVALLRSVLGKDGVELGLDWQLVRNIAPGVALTLLCVFVGLEFLGFYAACAVAFLLLAAAYDPRDYQSPANWLRWSLVTLGFMVIVYLLFTVLLKVQVLRPWFL